MKGNHVEGARGRWGILVALGQALYYLPTGIWPLVSMKTFMLVTGPKTDHWLVRTVSALLAVIGAVAGLAGLRRKVSLEIALLCSGSCTVLALVDIIYVARRRISPIYLGDALAELVLLAGWLVALAQPSEQEE